MKVTIVTGAGSGIGASAARLLASRGHAVTLVGRSADALDEVAGPIAAAGGRALCVPADLVDPASPALIVERTVAAFGGITGLVNNAATIKTMPLADYTLPVLNEHWAVNIRATFLLTQAALPWLPRCKGAVVNISSSSGTTLRSGQSLYGITKAALNHLTRSFAGEFSEQSVRFNAIACGPATRRSTAAGRPTWRPPTRGSRTGSRLAASAPLTRRPGSSACCCPTTRAG
jgi:NAD(P)-dependent dehydrogenase (short-subunit alcohol dehydrogenase family)